MSDRTISSPIRSAISSPASAFGAMPCGAPDGLTTDPSGPASARMGRLRGYGNAIVAPAAQVFIEAYLETEASRHLQLTPETDIFA